MGVKIFQSSIVIDNSNISYNSTSGIDFDDITKSLFSNNNISNNGGTTLNGLVMMKGMTMDQMILTKMSYGCQMQ